MRLPPSSQRRAAQHRAAARHNRGILWGTLGLGGMVVWWLFILSSGLYQRFILPGWILSPALTLYTLWLVFRGFFAILRPPLHEQGPDDEREAQAANEASLAGVGRGLDWLTAGPMGFAPFFALALFGVFLLCACFGVMFVLSTEEQPLHVLWQVPRDLFRGTHAPAIWAILLVGVGMPLFALGVGGVTWGLNLLWERARRCASLRGRDWLDRVKAQGGPSLVFSATGLFLLVIPSLLLLLAGYDSIGVAIVLLLGGVLALGGLGWAVLRIVFDTVSRGLKSWRAR